VVWKNLLLLILIPRPFSFEKEGVSIRVVRQRRRGEWLLIVSDMLLNLVAAL